jgi:hypothetical protein
MQVGVAKRALSEQRKRRGFVLRRSRIEKDRGVVEKWEKLMVKNMKE